MKQNFKHKDNHMTTIPDLEQAHCIILQYLNEIHINYIH